MIQNGTTTQTSVVMPATGDRSRTREAVQHALNHATEKEMNGDHYATLNGNGYHGHDDDEGQKVAPTKPWQFVFSLLSTLEPVVVSIYNCVGIGLHAGLAIAFLAIVAIMILGSFHDRYWVTILDRARRTDGNLLNEITYYQRRCDVTDVTVSDSHDIHFGDVDDRASEIFIDVEKIRNELGDDDSEQDYHYDERGFRTKYQVEEKNRRRRRFAPIYNIWESPELKPIPEKVAEKAGDLAVKTMMKHGSVMIPQMLSDATISELRRFVDQKNERVDGTKDEYPMTAQHHRISYGIESTEHPAVVRALKEIHNHRVFANLIQNLVGDENPALSEITAITAWAGAEDQSWHADVKPDGNGVKFGRTYSHSYSLFLPLQDTSGKMGPTELCPGTHMCASEDLWEVCDQTSVSLNDVRRARPRDQYSPDEYGEEKYQEDRRLEGIWRAGDGALLNQQGWHRGTGHTDEQAEDRIVFIVSFLKRPNADDPRQLARGTYFHQKWLNWGSTWEDMVDTMSNLQRPWNILRCLHLYKPSYRSWGYDLFTATTLRIANAQMGGEPADLSGVIDNVMEPLQYPEWLQGTIDYDDDYAWQIYMKGTIRKTSEFLFKVNIYGHIGLVAFLAIASILGHLYKKLIAKATAKNEGQRSVVGTVLASGAKRLLLTHGSIFTLGCYVWYVTICSSRWAIDIDSGKTYMRPFPTNPIFRDEDPGVLGVQSTLPRRSDVLIGTRMNTKAIGAYHTWLNYHPGNRVFDQFIEANGGTGGFYHSVVLRDASNQTTSGLPSGLSESLENLGFDLVTKQHGGGRFVMQDYRSGDWMVLTEEESRDYIKKRLLIGSKYDTALGTIQEEINQLLDIQRFGFPRRFSSMSWISQLFLFDLSKEVFSTKFDRDARKTRKQTGLFSALYPSLSIVPSQSGYRLPKLEPIAPTVSSAKDKDGNRSFLIGKSAPAFRPGMEIYLVAKNEADEVDIFPGTVIDLAYTKRSRDGYCKFELALEEEGIAELDAVQVTNIHRSRIKPRKPIVSGDRVAVNLEDGYYAGTVLLVLADGSIDVLYDSDGAIDEGIRIEEYKPLEFVEQAL